MRAIKIRIKNSSPSVVLLFSLAMVLIALSCSQVSSQQRGREFIQKEKAAVQQPKLAKSYHGLLPELEKSEFNHTLIDFSSLTHLAHAFTKPDSEGNLIIDQNYLYPEMVTAAHSHSVKVVMSIGGWGNCDGFPPTVRLS